MGLRKGIFALEPAEIGIARHPKYTVWGFLMEMGTPQSVVSLVALPLGYLLPGWGVMAACVLVAIGLMDYLRRMARAERTREARRSARMFN